MNTNIGQIAHLALMGRTVEKTAVLCLSGFTWHWFTAARVADQVRTELRDVYNQIDYGDWDAAWSAFYPREMI